MQPCASCPLNVTAAASRVRLNGKSWSGSPNTWLGGYYSDLQVLISAGMAERLPNGWHIPTATFPRVTGTP